MGEPTLYLQNPRVTLGLTEDPGAPRYVDRITNQPVAAYEPIDEAIFDKLAAHRDASTLDPRESSRFEDLVAAGVYVFDEPRLHLQYPLHLYHSMLLNTDRMLPYIEALGRLVKPDMVVWELGSGLSVFAMTAARLGARVYALEPGISGDIALAILRENDLEDRVVLERGLLGEHEPSVRADIVVSEFIGDDIFEEEIVRFASIARERYLAPDGLLLPCRLASRATAVEHAGLRSLALRQQRELQAAAGLVGLKVDCLEPVVQRMLASSFILSDYRRSVSDERPSAIPIGTTTLQDVDLMREAELPIHGAFELVADNDGYIDAWYVHFSADFPGVTRLGTGLLGPAMFSWPEIWIPGPRQRRRVAVGETVRGRWLYKRTYGVRSEASHARGLPRYEIRLDG